MLELSSTSSVIKFHTEQVAVQKTYSTYLEIVQPLNDVQLLPVEDQNYNFP